MNARRGLLKMGRYADLFTRVVGVLATVLLVVGWVSSFWAWGSTGPFAWISSHTLQLWLVGLTCFVITIGVWTYRLRSRFDTGFRDNFGSDLRRNWDFEGDWRIPERGTLLVTGGQSTSGDWLDGAGITKVGAQWENYSFSFRARILSRCLGVVVRAQDLSNYYMFQIGPDHITPHRRVSVPVLEKDDDGEPAVESVAEQSALHPADTEQSASGEDDPGCSPGDGTVVSPVEECAEEVRDACGSSGPKEGMQLDQAQRSDPPATNERGSREPASVTIVQPIKFRVGWAIMSAMPLPRSLTDWFDVRLSVRGQSARLYIDGGLMFQKESFLAIPVGKVGFRNWGPEEALVRDVRVRLDQ